MVSSHRNLIDDRKLRMVLRAIIAIVFCISLSGCSSSSSKTSHFGGRLECIACEWNHHRDNTCVRGVNLHVFPDDVRCFDTSLIDDLMAPFKKLERDRRFQICSDATDTIFDVLYGGDATQFAHVWRNSRNKMEAFGPGYLKYADEILKEQAEKDINSGNYRRAQLLLTGLTTDIPRSRLLWLECSEDLAETYWREGQRNRALDLCQYSRNQFNSYPNDQLTLPY